MSDHKLARALATGKVFTSLGASERRAIRILVEDRDNLLYHAEKLAEEVRKYLSAKEIVNNFASLCKAQDDLMEILK